jgi:hypothetical protein
MLSDFDSYVHRSDLAKDFSSEAHNSMALRIDDLLIKERHVEEELKHYNMDSFILDSFIDLINPVLLKKET